ncbi:hypothetical protein SBA4_2150037 [Candidatus Sulfopaludibacter sp. SbA4]|nr:hypothetical protein SBA4_2150037 [Candidatus Sulfopaludibacter sp. SbA4]
MGNSTSHWSTIRATRGNRVFYVAARDVNDLNNTDWHAIGTQAVK